MRNGFHFEIALSENHFSEVQDVRNGFHFEFALSENHFSEVQDVRNGFHFEFALLQTCLNLSGFYTVWAPNCCGDLAQRDYCVRD